MQNPCSGLHPSPLTPPLQRPAVWHPREHSRTYGPLMTEGQGRSSSPLSERGVRGRRPCPQARWSSTRCCWLTSLTLLACAGGNSKHPTTATKHRSFMLIRLGRPARPDTCIRDRKSRRGKRPHHRRHSRPLSPPAGT